MGIVVEAQHRTVFEAYASGPFNLDKESFGSAAEPTNF